MIKFSVQILLVFGLAFSPVTRAAEPKSTGWLEWTGQVLVESKNSTTQFFSELTYTQVRGFAVVLAVMGLTTQAMYLINTKLPPSLGSLSTFVAIIGGLGVYSFGAPLFEKPASQIRAEGFRQFAGRDAVLTEAERKALNDLWARIQLELSINEQMARNVKVQALMSIRPHLIEGLRHINTGDEEYAVMQIAYCAVFVRKLFPELLASDPDLNFVVRTLFTQHIHNSQQWKTKVLLMIGQLAPSVAVGDREFYADLLDFWLGK